MLFFIVLAFPLILNKPRVVKMPVLSTNQGSRTNSSSGYWILHTECKLIFFFIINTFLRAVLSLQKNWRGDTEISHIPPANTPICIASFIINILHQSGTLVVNGEPSLTHHSYPKSIVYIMVHYWFCTCYASGHMYDDMYALLWYHTEYFVALKILCF